MLSARQVVSGVVFRPMPRQIRRNRKTPGSSERKWPPAGFRDTPYLLIYRPTRASLESAPASESD